MSNSCNQPPSKVNYWITQLNNSHISEIVEEFRIIAESDSYEPDSLTNVIHAFTHEDILVNSSTLFGEMLKEMKGNKLLLSLIDTNLKELLGKFAASLLIACSLEGLLRQASDIVILCKTYQIRFQEFEPLNAQDKITPCQIALVAVEALDYTRQYDVVINLLEDINWGGGQNEVSTKLFILGKVLYKLLPVSRFGINCDNLKYSSAILQNLIKRYHHDKNVINVNYASYIDLASALKKIWTCSIKCSDKSCFVDIKKTVKGAIYHDIPLNPSLYVDYEAKKNEDFNNNSASVHNFEDRLNNPGYKSECRNVNGNLHHQNNYDRPISSSSYDSQKMNSDRFDMSSLFATRIAAIKNNTSIPTNNSLEKTPGSLSSTFSSSHGSSNNIDQNLYSGDRNTCIPPRCGQSLGSYGNSVVYDYKHCNIDNAGSDYINEPVEYVDCPPVIWQESVIPGPCVTYDDVCQQPQNINIQDYKPFIEPWAVSPFNHTQRYQGSCFTNNNFSQEPRFKRKVFPGRNVRYYRDNNF